MAILLNNSLHRPSAGIATDAAHSLKSKVTQYRGIDLRNGQELFYENLGNKTVNIGEFLGVVAAIKYIIETGYTPRTVYTDSMTAIFWINNKKTASKKRVPDLIRAEIFLKVMDAEIASINIIHWNTNEWGEIPADFGMK